MSRLNVDIGEFMGFAGEDVAVVREGMPVHDVRGIRNAEDHPRRRYVGLYPKTDVQAGDILRSKVSQEELQVAEAVKLFWTSRSSHCVTFRACPRVG